MCCWARVTQAGLHGPALAVLACTFAQAFCAHHPVLLLCSAVQLAGQQGHNVAVSRDAGRFVCNFTYYLSLLHSQTARQLRGAPLHALFVHVPPTTVAPLDQQFAFLLDVLAAVAAALTPAISSTYVGKYLASQAAVHIAAERAVDEHGKDPFQAVAADAAAANAAEATEASA